jgi:hypothetical protein
MKNLTRPFGKIASSHAKRLEIVVALAAVIGTDHNGEGNS